jgi:Ca2+-transporting ATPase
MDWHTLSKEEVITKTSSNVNGLTEQQARARLKQFGSNKLRKTRHFSALRVFLSQFKSFLIIILVFAAILSYFMESMIDSIVILAIIVLNAGLGFSQEYKAEKAIASLKKMMVSEARVMRNGKFIKIDSKRIVPGDVLILRTGDKIVADARIIESSGLKLNEAALTGESVAQEKILDVLKESVPLADRTNMVYQGTQIVSGNGKAIVIRTGMHTELGKISGLVQEVRAEKNPFKEKLDSFAKKIGIFILILSGIIIGLLILEGAEIFQSFLVAVSLAVSAIPEGLPAVISLGLALATKRMAKKNILIRKLPASETLGRTTVICVDKTGTITEEEMRVTSIYTNGRLNPKKRTGLLFKIGVLCNKARVEKDENGKEYIIGEPTEKALILSGKENFLDKKELTEKEPGVKEFPFTSERKMMSMVRKVNGKLISYVKGAPEKIIDRCEFELYNGRVVKLTENRRKNIIEAYEGMAKKGLRVLGFACKWVKKISLEDAENNLVFVGLQGMIDPPRPEVKNAIQTCKEAGIKILMMTGDSKLTADAVAKEIGLTGLSIDAIQLQKITDKQLLDNIDKISVFARISPEDKLRIVNILKHKKEIVAMTGDGVNDALALKRADIGIAMGKRGTDVARDSSDIILIDDNFASIVEGVKEGRRIYDNVKKFIKFLLSANFSEVFFVLLIMLIWRNPEFLPFLPLQILWINLVTDSLPALALSVEPMEKGIMKRKPNKEGILKDIIGFFLIAGIIGIILIAIVFFINVNIDKARTMVVSTSIIFEMFLVFNCKSNKSIFKSSWNKYLIYAVLASIGLHLAALYTPLSSLFSFVSLGLYDWFWIVGLALGGFIIMEIFKAIFMRKEEN